MSTPTATQAIALPPGIKSQEGVNAILGFLAMAFLDPKKPGEVKVIRTHGAETGKRWWQLSDVCDALAIANSRNVKKRIPGAFLTTVHAVDGGPQRTFIDISGVSQLILESRKPETWPYKAFINGVVVPELAATGGYAPKAPEELATHAAIAEAMARPPVLLPDEAPRPRLSLAALNEGWEAGARTARRLGLAGHARKAMAAKLASEACGLDLVALAKEFGVDLVALAKKGQPPKAKALPKPAAEPLPPNPYPPHVGPEVRITATELGHRLTPPRSAQWVNQALEGLGCLERHYPGSPTKTHEWRLTPLGAQLGGAVYPVDKAHNSGVTQQIRWAPSKVLAALSTDAKEHA